MVQGGLVGGATVSPSHKHVAVTLLDGNTLTFTSEVKTRVCEVVAQVCSYLETLGMQDTQLFGLSVSIDGEYVFADPDSKLSKYAPKSWKSSSNGLGPSGECLLQFRWVVQFYVETHLLLRDKVSQLHYYLQLRDNLLLYGQPVTEEHCFHIAALALQADLGDYREEQHHGHYFQPDRYFPQWLVDRMGAEYIIEHVPAMHRDNAGLTRSEAHAHYIREASAQEAPHNLHLLYLRHKKHDPSPQVALTIGAKGIDISEVGEEGGPAMASKKLLSQHQWSNITKLSFEKKKFEIRGLSYPGKLTFYTTSDEKSKHLLYLCRLTHQFNLALQPRVQEIKRLQDEDRRRYRESYIYSDRYSEIGALSDSLGGLRSYLAKDSREQRISIISSSSSNTTSGIVSDRGVLSLDGSEDDLDSNVLVGSPIDPSLESGIDSLTQSLTHLDSSSPSTHGHTPDYEEGCLGASSYSPSNSSPPGSHLSVSTGLCGSSDAGGISLGRAGSVHSSSSQHSASTVRSRYSLVPQRLPPELTLGAELADLSLAPDLPDLADLPGMVADGQGLDDDDRSGLCGGLSHTQHNCCSTCCDDDNADDDDDDDDNEGDIDRTSCNCGSCAVCVLEAASSGFLHQKLHSESSSMSGQRGDVGQESFHDSMDSTGTSQFYGSSTFVSDDASVMVQPDLDEHGISTYNFSDLDFSQLDNNDDYVEFYKDQVTFPSQSGEDIRLQDERVSPPLSSRHSPLGFGAQGVIAGNVGTTLDSEEDQQLDYSVESAQSIISQLAASYSPSLVISSGMYRQPPSVSNTFDTDSDYVQVSNNDNQFSLMASAAVSMSTVTTVTPIAVASSRINQSMPTDLTHKNQKPNTLMSSGLNMSASVSSSTTSDAVISEAAVANSSEAPAKFITSRPHITVLKAHTQMITSTAAPSFTSVPLSRGKVHTLPQVQIRQKADTHQSLQRGIPDFIDPRQSIVTDIRAHRLPDPRPYALPEARPLSLPESKPLGLPPLYARGQRSHKSKPIQPLTAVAINQHFDVPIIRKNNYLDVRASSNLNKNKVRIHPEKHPTITPRSLFLRDQQKALQQEQFRIQQLQQKMSSETVYQPALYAQGVGIPLLPSPTYTGYQTQQRSSQPIQHHPQQQQQPQPQPQSYYPQARQQQQQQQLTQPSYFYQPYIKNFFQNPPPPAPHPGFGMGACPNNSGAFQPVSLEIPSPTYQCASDPGLYPSQPHHQSVSSVYTNQVSQSQIEQFKAQMYSDVDYVIYPMKDPAISRQEYMDAKQSQVIATQAQQQQNSSNKNSGFVYLPPPPPYRSPKMSPLYRSTPNVASTLSSCGSGVVTSSSGNASLLSYPSYQSLTSHQPGSSSGYSSMARGRCFSQQSLTSSSVSSAPSGYSISTQSLTGSYEPYSEVMLRAASMMRVRSDESILSSGIGDTASEPMSPTPGAQMKPPPPYRPKVRTTHKKPWMGMFATPPREVLGVQQSVSAGVHGATVGGATGVVGSQVCATSTCGSCGNAAGTWMSHSSLPLSQTPHSSQAQAVGVAMAPQGILGATTVASVAAVKPALVVPRHQASMMTQARQLPLPPTPGNWTRQMSSTN